MEASTHYADAWEGFWRAAPEGEGEVLWDTAPQFAAARHLPLLTAHSGGAAALVDVGCGNGTQTRYFAARYRRVVGIDVSRAAIARALAGPATAADFRRVDAADPVPVKGLHAETGDADVYLRGVLHQCGPGDRARVASGAATLAGTRGRVLAVEPAASARDVLAALMSRPGGPPPSLAAVVGHGIAPAEMPDESVPALFAALGLSILAAGSAPLQLTLRDAGGSPVELPANWLVAGRMSDF
ncbi:class I SAM-dependent methyltransferase [Streptomyces sp. HNM0574]|uniref:class I SAM-dependent methyltransferase n=1 Tax=Streptomyces sp. HNM0574 TaxID=2714954 RepID=UPI00146DD31E|nr:class I SAM-dependent methyltransferase [Streptomyces sp. HNM0574]NLU66034.1 class I SAM-dependent methyltransferase [Streptomyces sp. HNM0574]